MAGTHEAHACSCSWPPEAETVEARQTWRLDQAKDIVTGKVVTVTAAEGYRGAHGLPAVAATLRVDKTVKGSVKGAIKLQTGFNGEDCGLAELLMNAVANDLPVTLELARIRKAPNQFWVHSCAFHRLETR
ncbi:LytS/YehU family sensor histidine kinase [Methylopila jiangsuensis]|uniref:hypothetical protein n=1 Tax=Methylopila jiangsuensis TaxID=586230 RepID=UPI0022F2ECC4|nr:hypothetical protein [Methylopila jiangsuensis]MDR6286129.1 LytS/YehU family sensor histidine kinase [Methylopila jiangsuensis]